MRRDPPRKLLVRTPNWLGDAVMCQPALHGLRTLFPQAELTVFAKAPVAELFIKDPDITHILVYDDKRMHAGIAGKWSLAGTLRQQRFDMAVLFQNAFEAAFLTWLAGIPRRYGYATDGRAMLLTEPIAVPDLQAPPHQVEYYWNLLKPLGLGAHVSSPRLMVSEDEEHVIDQRLLEAGIDQSNTIIGINPGSTYGSAKRWLPDRFAEVVRRLAKQLQLEGGQPVSVVILGAKGEEALGQRIAESIDVCSVVLSGATTIRELMAVVKRCRLLLTNDTGPMHIAAAFEVPVVAVFGPTDWKTTAPYGQTGSIVREPVDCAPCLLRECPIDHRCMTRVSVDRVCETAVQQIGGSFGSSGLSGVSGERVQSTNELNKTNQTNILSGYTIFLDRDGTLNPDPGYIHSPDQFELFPGVAEALARLKQAGAKLIVTTNQSGIARGLLSVHDLNAVHAKLQELLHVAGASLDAVYFCPHHPDDHCRCRKPNPGMIDQAQREHSIDLSRAYLIGDHVRDIELAKCVGVRSILVTTGAVRPEQVEAMTESGSGPVPDRIAASLAQAVEWVLSDAGTRSIEKERVSSVHP